MFPAKNFFKIIDFAENANAKEVWHFGSSVDPKLSKPNDIDLAILIENFEGNRNIFSTLLKDFPNAKIDYANSYTKKHLSSKMPSKYHFVIVNLNDSRLPIFQSIKNGKCLWKKN